jgi:hypothetical protein
MVKATLTLSEMLDRTNPPEPKHLKRWSMPPSYFGASWPSTTALALGKAAIAIA